jgi:hypothetical protein
MKSAPSLPNLFLVGASKAGTTSLHHYLKQHPQIFMSPVKEPHFFADEVRPWNYVEELRLKSAESEAALRKYLEGPVSESFSGGPVTEWADYAKLFQCRRDEPVAGESSPCYLWSKTAPGNIAARLPGSKIVMILRNPVERAFAQHLHMLMFAKSVVSFREHLETAARSDDRRLGELYPFLEFGLYSEQVERFRAHFPAAQIRIALYEELTDDPVGFLRGLFGFLGVDQTFEVDRTERHMQATVPRSFGLRNSLRGIGVWDVARRILPRSARGRIKKAVYRSRPSMKMSKDDRAWLIDYYRDDVGKLASLLDRDLSGWLAMPEGD